ncbi:MAG TPA: TatD family hydrolase [Candidatus Saccharibacteria bacterium]|nr:TatD family hydrolase [Candidatus Saccharibacteria bacterium]
MLIDTHCHIHEKDYSLKIANVLAEAKKATVEKIICVGTSGDSSKQAVRFAKKHKPAFSAVGVHPHDAKDGIAYVERLLTRKLPKKLVAVGEIGLDYFYGHSPREVQIKAFERQLELAIKNNLPVIFHVRDAFDDFWPIFDSVPNVRGVLHSFTDNAKNLEKALARGLYIGVNGISVFTKNADQQQTFDAIPLTSLLLETDAPFLTPPPYRGKINQPAYIQEIAEYHATRRSISVAKIAQETTKNAQALFTLS